jgi:peptide/nickel transport system permease protein
MTRRRWPRRIDPVVAVCSLFVLLIIFMAAAPSLFATSDPEKSQLSARLRPPGRDHVMGTDEFGRDIFSRVAHGAQVSVKVGGMAVAIAALAGVAIGLLAGYTGGGLDLVAMRMIDVVLAFPAILLALVMITMLRPSIESLMVAMGIVYAPRFARLARGGALAAKRESYVEAARAVGAGDGLIVWRHILPNISGPLLVQATITLPQAILAEASLSFLGLGVQPPTPAWGAMLSSGRRFMEVAPWVTIFPGGAIAATALAVNFLGDALQDWANPKTRRLSSTP